MKTNYISIRLKSILVVASASFLIFQQAVAQAPHREEITVIAPYEPTIPDVFKINIQPKIEAEEITIPQVVISITPQKLNVTHSTEPVQEAPPPAERQQEMFRNHIRGGFGNYTTPYLEFNAGSLRNPDYHLNMQLRHLSSWGQIKDYGHSAFSDNLARVSAKRFFENLTLGADVHYKNNLLHHYGFPVTDFPDTVFNTAKDDLKQRFNQAGAIITAKSNNKNREGFHYQTSLGYGYTGDLFETKEHRFELESDVKASYMLFRSDDKQSLGLKLNAARYQLTDTLQKWNNTLITAQPYISFRYQEYEIRAGLQLAFDTDTTTHFRLFPVAEGRLHLVKNRLAVFVGVDGSIEKNAFNSIAMENPFIHSSLEYRNTLNKFRFYGGLQGSAGKRFDYKTSVSNTIAGDVLLFVNDTLAPFNRFLVIYDDMNIVQGHLSASYTISQRLRINGGFDVFHYSPENEDKAWHKPAFKGYLESRYTHNEQLAFRASLNASGKSWARVFDSNTRLFEEMEIKPWIDVSLGATYRLNDQLHFFVDARNITAGRHYYWYNYPGQRLHVMAGAGFSF